MKTFAIILIFGFAWKLCNGSSKFEEMKTCLVQNGFTNDYIDLERLQAIGDPENIDKLKGISKEKMCGVVACIYEKQYGNTTLFAVLEDFVVRNDKISEDQQKEMLETLTTCNSNAAGDKIKLLTCVNGLTPPFDEFSAIIRDIPYLDSFCFSKSGMTISEMYKMEENKNMIRKILKFVSEDKLNSFMACIFEETENKNPDQTALKKITNTVNSSKKHDENQKKKMLMLLNNCNTKVAEDKDKTYELIRCVNMFQPPFVDLY